MTYILKLTAIDIREDDNTFEGSSEIILHYPTGGNFATHVSLGNALATLVPTLLGEVVVQINNAEDENNKEEMEQHAKEVE